MLVSSLALTKPITHASTASDIDRHINCDQDRPDPIGFDRSGGIRNQPMTEERGRKRRGCEEGRNRLTFHF